MPNFGLPLLLNWRPLRKTSYLKIKGLCGKGIYNLLKTELDKRKNKATRRQTGELPSNEPTKVTRAATRPFLAKKKATPKTMPSKGLYFPFKTLSRSNIELIREFFHRARLEKQTLLKMPNV